MRAVIYCRVDGPINPFSTDAIRGQEIQLKSYAEKQGLEITGVYTDIGYSGLTLERPGLCSVIQAAQNGKADTILVVNRDRLFRGRFPKELQEFPVVSIQERILSQERGGVQHEL